MLRKLGFHSPIVDLIMQSVTTVPYSFLLNSSKFGSLTPFRGIRQRDPISPYLFICCVEKFIQMVEKAVGSGRRRGVHIAPSTLIISNLCFADDTILFCQTTTQEAAMVRSILNKYAAALGQIINVEKATMVFSPNIRPGMESAIQQSLPFQVVPKFDKYLGLPARIGRSKVEMFSNLKERLWSLVRGWNEHHIFTAGREVLIKAVLQDS